MGKINTRPLSGMRDFLPLEVLRRKYVIGVVEEVYQSYGFEPLETPSMERLDTLLGKYGEEGDQLIFRVMKRGEKLARILEDSPAEDELADSGLRYDLTVPLARVAAEYQSELPRIFKRYQIQPVYRADRPARGRFREFYQCDLDIVGSTGMTVELEVLSAAAEVLRKLGFSTDDFSLRLNHRGILHSLMAVSGVSADQEESALVAIDKLDKIGREGVEAELLGRGLDPVSVSSLLEVFISVRKDETNNATVAVDLKRHLGEEEDGSRGLAELEWILEAAEKTPAAGCLRLDPSLARGLSYYTGAIFEVEMRDSGVSAGGGGRYDDLIGMFSGRKIPSCGFSLGLERIILLMQEKEMFPADLEGIPRIMVTLFSEELIPESLSLLHRLREAGHRADLYPEPGKYGKQFKYAEQRGIRYAALQGPAEIEKGVFTLKDLKNGDQREVPLAQDLASLDI